MRRPTAIERYQAFVRQGIGRASIWCHLKSQIYLGDEMFVLRMQEKFQGTKDGVNFPKAQRRPPALPLTDYQNSQPSRDEAIVAAYGTGVYSYQEIAEFFGLHFTTVGKIVRAAKPKIKPKI